MPTFRVLLTASASVHGRLTVKAESASHAQGVALEQLGDVVWQYDGVDDTTAEVVEVVPNG